MKFKIGNILYHHISGDSTYHLYLVVGYGRYGYNNMQKYYELESEHAIEQIDEIYADQHMVKIGEL